MLSNLNNDENKINNPAVNILFLNKNNAPYQKNTCSITVTFPASKSAYKAQEKTEKNINNTNNTMLVLLKKTFSTTL